MKTRGPILAGLVLALAAVASRGGEVPAPTGLPAPKRVGPPVKEVRRGDLVVETLPNGTCLAVKRAPTSGVVAVQFWVGAGSVTEGRWTNRGISHFVEHMLFEGTVRQRGRGFDLLVRSLGGVHNGYTSLEETVYHVTVPSAGYREVTKALVELVRGGALPAERFQSERKVLIQELREGEDNVRRLSGRLLSETIFRVHPYRCRVGGDISEFKKLSHEDLKEYHRKLYVPGNEMVVIAGDVDVSEALGLGRELLGGSAAMPLPDISRPEEPEQTAPRHAERRHPRVKKARVMFAWRTVDLLHPDLFALDVLAMILGEGRSSRLYRSLKEEQGVVYSVGAYSWTPRDPGYLGVWAECEDSRVGRVRSAVAHEIEDLRTLRVLPDELSRARARVEAGQVFRRQTAEGVARDLASDLLFTGDPDFGEKYLAGVRAVTADDVLQAARTYLVESRMSVAVLRPEKPPLAAAKGGELKAAPREGKRTIDVQHMPGGSRLVLVPDRSLPIVSVSATLLAGLRQEPEGKAGVSAMLARVMPKGTRGRSGEELAAEIEGRGGSFGVVSGRNSLSVRVEMLSRDLPAALELAAEIMAEPRLEAEDIERVRAETLAAIRSRSERAWAAASELLMAALFKGHAYSTPDTGTVESVESITRDDLASFHRGIARRGNLVLAVAGDFDPAEAAKAARDAFARLPGDEFRFEAPAPALPPEPGSRVEKTLPGSRSAVVLWGFPGARMGTKEAYALDIAAEALAGMSGRLWNAVREEHGLAYAVGAYNAPQVDPGYFGLYVATRPEWEAKALALLKKELAKLIENPPAGEELARAKASLTGEDAISLQARGSLAMRCALYERYGLGARAALDLAGRLAAVTAGDVAAAAKKYLDPDGGVVAVVRP